MLLNALAANCTDGRTPNSYLLSWDLAFGTVARADVANNITPCHLYLHLFNMRAMLLVSVDVGGAYIFGATLDDLAIVLVSVDMEGVHIFRAPLDALAMVLVSVHVGSVYILRPPLEAKKSPKDSHGLKRLKRTAVKLFNDEGYETGLYHVGLWFQQVSNGKHGKFPPNPRGLDLPKFSAHTGNVDVS